MAFVKRLGFYLFGLAIGLIFLSIFLKKKSEETGVSFCYLPNCRVLKDLRSKKLSYSNDIQNAIREKQIDSLQINQFLLDGDVDFGKSDTESKPCKTYFIENDLNDKTATLKIKSCNNKILIEALN